MQSVDDKPRYHVDFETDDVEAAVEKSRWLDCRTLLVPGGQLICVIRLHSHPVEFALTAHAWASGTDSA